MRCPRCQANNTKGMKFCIECATQPMLGYTPSHLAETSSDLHMDCTAVGHTTHLAARMEQMAMPGAILTTPLGMRIGRKPHLGERTRACIDQRGACAGGVL